MKIEQTKAGRKETPAIRELSVAEMLMVSGGRFSESIGGGGFNV
ncbi:hypothetical protein ACG74X_19535 [Marivita sp. S0852]